VSYLLNTSLPATKVKHYAAPDKTGKIKRFHASGLSQLAKTCIASEFCSALRPFIDSP
jgi:hypothetical protein